MLYFRHIPHLHSHLGIKTLRIRSDKHKHILEQGGSLEIILEQPHFADKKCSEWKVTYVEKMQFGEDKEKIKGSGGGKSEKGKSNNYIQ